MTVPRWEWRTFGERLDPTLSGLQWSTPERTEESDEVYVLARGSDASVKVRGGRLDVKQRLHAADDGLEQWMPVMKADFPLSAHKLAFVLARLAAGDIALERSQYTPEQIADEVVAPAPDLTAVRVHKRRVRYTVGGCMAEVSEFTTEYGSLDTIAIESEEPERVRAAVRQLGLDGRPVMGVARGLKALVGFGPRRCAAIDVGTNSVKLYVAEAAADGWRDVLDRVIVTRLGEGLERTGRLSPEGVERTVAAIAELAAEARREGAEAIAAAGTAALRAAADAEDFVAAVRERCRVAVEVISADEEARLAYLAATESLGPGGGTRVLFDTGGGSSQFTFGDGERFSVEVGAVRLTERFGLDGAASEDAVAAALAAAEEGLDRLRGRSPPDAIAGIGGAVTNLAAVRLELAVYDPTAVRGTTLDRREIDRQIEVYRRMPAEGRRGIVGLQPGRAEVILAGAVIVRAVLGLLGRDSLIVSDRGLRHGLIAARFSAPPSTAPPPPGATGQLATSTPEGGTP